MENLLESWDVFKKGKRDKYDVMFFERHLEDNLFRLHQELATKTYRSDAYVGFYVRDPKIRHIHKATVRDRVIHHAIFRVLSPIFESTFISDSYACRKDKGTHKGVLRLRQYARKVEQTHGTCFALKCDVKKFFPSIDHKILLDIMRRRIRDDDTIWLLDTIVKSFCSDTIENGRQIGIGLLIGNLTSQLFANIYLNELDQFSKHALKTKHYLRYADDFIFLHHDHKYLDGLKRTIGDFLSSRLNLLLHPNKVHVRKFGQGIDFLGYVVLPHCVVPRAKVRRRIFKKLRRLVQQFKDGTVTEKSMLRSFDSYGGFLVHADSHALRQKLHQQFWEWLKEPQKRKKGQPTPAAHIDRYPKGLQLWRYGYPSNPQL